MSTIFEKLPASGEKCLILEPREALVYPFSVGDWNQLRLGMFISTCGINGDNSLSSDNDVVGPVSKKEYMYLGLAYVSGATLPYSSGFNFIGTANALAGGGAYTNILFRDDAIVNGFGTSLHVLSTIDTSYQINSTSYNAIGTPAAASRIRLSSYAQRTGASSYGAFYGINYTINDKGLVSQSFTCSSSSSAGITNMSIDNLRSFITTQPNSVPSVTGYRWVTPLADTGTPLPLPNNIFLYFPFLNNRIRIHAITVEKWA